MKQDGVVERADVGVGRSLLRLDESGRGGAGRSVALFAHHPCFLSVFYHSVTYEIESNVTSHPLFMELRPVLSLR